MTRTKARRTSIKKKQRFHSKVFPIERVAIPSEPTGTIVSNSGTFYRKIPIRTYLKQDKKPFEGFVRDADIARRMTVGESILLNGVLKEFNRQAGNSTVKRSFSLRGPKLLRVAVSRTNPKKNFILMELLRKPTVEDLDNFVAKGFSGKGEKVDKWCAAFIEENDLNRLMTSPELKEQFRIQLDSASQQAIRFLRQAGKKFKVNTNKRGLPTDFGFDFEYRNLVVESSKNGRFGFVLINPLVPKTSKTDLPLIPRTKKRDSNAKLAEWEKSQAAKKSSGEFYSTEGHPKRRKK